MRLQRLAARVPPQLRAAILVLFVGNVLFLWGIHDANATSPCVAPDQPRAHGSATLCPTYLNPRGDHDLALVYLKLGWLFALLLTASFFLEARRAPRP